MWLTGASPGPELLSSSHCGPASQRGCSTARCKQETRCGKAPARRSGDSCAGTATPTPPGLPGSRLCSPSKGLRDPLGPSGSVLERECRKLAHIFCIPVLQCGLSLSPSQPHWQCLESLRSFFHFVALINSKDHMHGPSSRHGGRKTVCL